MAHHNYNLTGTICPIPVIRTQDRIAELLDGDTLEVLCSDPGALHDIPTWCRIHGHSITSAVHEPDGLIRIAVLVQKQ